MATDQGQRQAIGQIDLDVCDVNIDDRQILHDVNGWLCITCLFAANGSSGFLSSRSE